MFKIKVAGQFFPDESSHSVLQMAAFWLWSQMVEREGEIISLMSLLARALTPFMMASHSWPNHLPKASPPNIFVLVIRFHIWILKCHKSSVQNDLLQEVKDRDSSERRSLKVEMWSPETITFWACKLMLQKQDVFTTGVSTATAMSLQLCPTLCDPIDCSPPGSPVPGILQARTLEWVAISFSNAGKWKVKVKSLSRVRLLATPLTTAYQAPPSMGFSRQEYWSGVPLPSPSFKGPSKRGMIFISALTVLSSRAEILSLFLVLISK